ncbi:hypothetical protein LJC12_01405 [Odoribacter sp. OttesenSCG-928-J03]|nr:hypothetical protein [Odoribacter sp. OttesenSCG-928-J03]MDL2330730.1 hypothetical protein [Odoribacter sp. OttesenSCG-928-A06]
MKQLIKIFILFFFFTIGIIPVLNAQASIEVSFETEVLEEEDGRYVEVKIFMTPTGLAVPAIMIWELRMDVNAEIFSTLPTGMGNKDFSFTPSHSAWDSDAYYDIRATELYPLATKYFIQISRSAMDAMPLMMCAMMTPDCPIKMPNGARYHYGTIKWKLLSTVQPGEAFIRIREDSVEEGANSSGALDLSMNWVDVTFNVEKRDASGAALITFEIPADPSQGIPVPVLPNDWLTYICSPEKTVEYTATKPAGVDECKWYLSTDAAGNNEITDLSNIADIVVTESGEKATITWKATTMWKKYYLQVYSLKDGTDSDRAYKEITVEGIPTPTIGETLACKETALTWTPGASGVTTFLYHPDLGEVSGSSKTLSLNEISDDTVYFVSARDISSCSDTFAYGVSFLNPEIYWAGKPAAQVGGGESFMAWVDINPLPEGFTADFIWTKPEGIPTTQRVINISSATEAQYEFIVHAEIKVGDETCSSNELTAITTVDHGSVEPNVMDITGSTTPIACKDGGVMLMVNPSGGLAPYKDYKWYVKGDAGNILSTDKTAWVTPTEDTEYVVELSDNMGSTGSATIKVTYKTSSSIAISAGVDQQIIQNTYTYLNATATTMGDAVSCNWKWAPLDKLNGGELTASPKTINLPLIGSETTSTYKYSVYAIDNNGCMSNVDTVDVVVKDNITDVDPDDFKIEYTPLAVTLCKNNSVQYVMSSEGIDLTGATYVWSPSAGLDDATIASPVLTAASGVESGAYLVTITKGDLLITRKVDVTVIDESAPVIAFVDEDMTCTGQILEVTHVSGPEPESYVWIDNDGVATETAENTFKLQVVGQQNIRVYAKTSGTTCASDTLGIDKNIGNGVQVEGLNTEITTCDLVAALSFDQITPTDASYTWLKGDKSVLASDVNPTPVSESGTYYLAKGSGICADTAEITVKVGNVLAVDGLQLINTSCEATGELAFTSTTAVTFTWLNSEKQEIADSKDQNPLTVDADGVYYLALDGGNCYDTITTGILLNTQPIVDVLPLQTSCDAQTNIVATATTGTLYWSQAADGSDPELLTTPVTSGGTYYVFAEDANGCKSELKAVDVELSTAPIILAESLQTACDNSVTLVAQASGGEPLFWQKKETDDTYSDLTSADVTESMGTEYRVYAKSSSSCESVPFDITVAFNTHPEITVEPLQTSCNTEVELVASSTGGQIIWTDKDGNLLVGNIAKGNAGDIKTFYVYAQGDQADCKSEQKKVEVRFGAAPELTVEPVQTTCGTQITLAATSNTGNIRWLKTNYSELSSQTVTMQGEDKVAYYYVYAYDGSCKSDTTEVRVGFNSDPEIKVVSPQTTCDPNTITLQASTTGGTIVWETLEGVRLTSETVTKNGDNPQQYVVYAEEAGGCKSMSETVEVQFSTKPEVIVEQPTQTSCGNAHAMIAYATGGELVWETADGEELASNIVSTPGTYKVYAKDACGSSDKKEITVELNTPPTITVEKNQSTCGTEIKLIAYASAGEPTWKTEDGTILSTSQVTGLEGTTVKYKVFASNGTGCQSNEEEVTVTFGGIPVVEVEKLQTTCGTEHQLTASAASGVEIIWTDGTNTITNLTRTGQKGDVQTYYVYGKDGDCEGEPEEVTVVFGTVPTVTVNDITTCGTSATLTASISGGTAVWTTEGGVDVSNDLERTGQLGESQVYYVYTKDGSCVSTEEKLTVTFGANPEIITSPVQTSCGEEHVLVATSTNASAEIHWRDAATDTPLTDLKVTGQKGVSQDYIVYAKDGSCTGEELTVTVHFGQEPIVTVTPLQTSCDAVVKLEAETTDGTLVWEDSDGNKILSAQVSQSDDKDGTYYVYAESDGCTSVKQMVKVEFNTLPEVIVQDVQTACEDTHTLTAEATNGEVVWLNAARTQELSNLTVTGTDSEDYWVFARTNKCSGDTVKVNVQFFTAPTVTVTSPQTTCGDMLQLEAVSNGGSLVWMDSERNIITPVVSGQNEMKQYIVYAQGTTCAGTEKTVTVEFGAAPVVIAQPLQTTCGTEMTIQAEASQGKLTWVTDGPLVQQKNGEASATYEVYAEFGSCVGETFPITVVFNASPIVTAESPQTTCGDVIELTAETTGGELVWEDIYGNKLNNLQIKESEAVSDVYKVYAKDEHCTSLPKSVAIAFNTQPVILAETLQTTCGDEYTLEAAASDGMVLWLDNNKEPLKTTKVLKANGTEQIFYARAIGSGEGCVSDNDTEITVKFGAKPQITVEPVQAGCEEMLELQATTTGGKLFWKDGSDNLLVPAVVYASAINGPYSVYAANSVDDYSCRSEVSSVTVEFGSKPSVTVEPLQTACGTTHTLQATASSGSDLHWLNASKSAELTGSDLTVSGTKETPKTFYVYAENANGCRGEDYEVVVAFESSPLVTTFSPQTSCSANSFPLQASATGGDLVWTVMMEGTEMPHDGTASTVVIDPDEVYTYYVQAKDGECLSNKEKIEVVFGGKPEVVAENVQTSCSEQHVITAAASGGELKWLDTSKKPMASGAVSGALGTDSTYYVYVQDQSCISDTVAITVAFGANPQIEVNPIQTACGTEIFLEATATGGTVVWEDSDGTQLATTHQEGTENEERTYRVYAEGQNGCTSIKKEVKVRFGAQPVVTVQELQTSCEDTHELIAEASEGELIWYAANQVTVINNTTVTKAQGDTYWVQAKTNNICQSALTKVTVLFSERPLVTVTTPQTSCTGQLQLEAKTTAGELVWLNSQKEQIYLTQVNGIAGTEETFYVYAENPEQTDCRGAEHEVKALFGVKPEVLTPEIQTACGTEYVLQATASFGEVIWLASDNKSDVLASTTVQSGGAAKKEYYAYAKGLNCEGDTKKITVYFETLPVVETTPLQTTCGDVLSLKAEATGGQLSWRKEDGEVLAVNQVTGTPGTNAYYYVKTVGTSCESQEEMVEVRFGVMPVVIAEPLQTSCTDQHLLKGESTAGQLVWLKDDYTELNNTTVNKPQGSTYATYYAYAKEGDCVGDTVKVNVAFGTKPLIDVASLQTACSDTLNLKATTTAGQLVWKDAGGTELVTAVAVKPGSTYTVYAQGDGCTSDVATVTVEYQKNPTLLVDIKQTSCSDQFTLQAQASGGNVYWLKSDQSTPLESTTVTKQASVDSTIFYAYAKGAEGCESPKQRVVAYFETQPELTVSPLQTTCDNELKLEATTTGEELVWTDASDNVIIPAIVKQGEGTTYYVQAVGSEANCMSDKKEVTVKFGVKPELDVKPLQTSCGLTYTLEGTASAGKLIWRDKDGVLTNLQVSATAKGEIKEYYVKADAGGECVSEEMTVRVAFGTDPIVSVLSTQTSCGETIELQATSSGNGGVIWTDAEGVKLSSTTVNKGDVAEHTYYVYAKDGQCTGLKEQVTVLFDEAPMVIAEQTQTSCNNTLTLKAEATDGKIVWRNALNQIVDPTITTGGTYWATAVKEGCTSRTPTKITAKLSTPPTFKVDLMQYTCSSPYKLQASTSGGEIIWQNSSSKELLSNNVVVVPGDTATYYVYVKGTACPTMAPEKVQVVYPGLPELVLEDAHCINDTIKVFTNNEYEAQSYKWFINGVEKSEFTSNYYVFTETGSAIQVEVVGEAVGGCLSDTVSATVNIAQPKKLAWDPSMTPPAEVEYGSNLQGCATTLDAAELSDIATWHWILPTSETIDGRCFTFPATEQEYKFKVYAVDKNACLTDTIETSTKVNGFAPLGLVLESESGATICEGGSAILRAEVTGGDDNSTYTFEWYLGEKQVKKVSINNRVDYLVINPKTSSGLTYEVRVRDNQAVPGVAKEEITLDIQTGLPLPIANAGPDMTIESGVKTVLKGVNTGNVDTWKWLPENKLASAVESDKQNPLTSELTKSQVYELYVTDKNGCTSSKPDTAIVYVLPLSGTEPGLPTPPASEGLNLVIVPENTTLCQGNEQWISVKDISGNLSQNAQYVWEPEAQLSLNTKGDSALFKATGAGDYEFVVTVTDTDGKKMALRSTIQVGEGIAPQFDLATTGNCQGDTVKVVYKTDSPEGTAFQWRVKGNAINNDKNYYVLNVVGNYDVDLTIENNSCVSNRQVASVTVNAAPEITLMEMTDSCGRAVIEVKANGATEYTWTSDPAGTEETPTRYIIDQTGAFEVTVSASNGTCAVESTLTGEVFERPEIEWLSKPEDANKNAEITAQVLVKDGTGTPGYTYHWLSPEVLEETDGEYKIAQATLASYKFEVYAVDSKGCTTTDTLREEISISGGDFVVNISSVYGNEMCQDGAAMLVAEISGATAPYTFQWHKVGDVGYVRNKTQQDSHKDTLWIEAADAGKYYVAYMQAGAVKKTSAELDVTVGSNQAPKLTTEPMLTIPQGGSTVLLSEVTDGTLPYAWHWAPASKLATLADTASQYPVTATLSADQTYTAYVTDMNNCVSAPKTTNVVVDDVNGLCVSVNPATGEICRGNTIQMVADVTCGKPTGWPLVYSWQPSDNGLLNVTDQDTVVFTPSAEGEYSWVVKVTNNTYVAAAIATINVKDADAPQLQLDGRWDCMDDTIKLINNGTPATAYVWTVDNIVSSVTTNYYVLDNKDIEHIEVYAESTGCRSDLIAKDLNLGVIPSVEILGGPFVMYPDSVKVIKVKQNEELTAENCIFVWSSDPIEKIEGLGDGLSVTTKPMSEDVKYTFTATSKTNAVCQAYDTVWTYIIPQKAAIEIDKDEATGNILLSWDQDQLGAADSVRVMAIKWDGYGTNSSYEERVMVEGALGEYMVDISKDTLEFFYINASRYIEELGESYHSLPSDTVGYMKQWLYAKSGKSTNNNYITFPFDMQTKGLLTKEDLIKYVGFVSGTSYYIQTLAHQNMSTNKWMVLSTSNSGTFVGSGEDIVVGAVYKIVVRENTSLTLYGKMPRSYVYDMVGPSLNNYIATPLSFGYMTTRSDLGDIIPDVASVASFIFEDQKWLVSSQSMSGAWIGTSGAYNINVLRPVKVTLRTGNLYNWSK